MSSPCTVRTIEKHEPARAKSARREENLKRSRSSSINFLFLFVLKFSVFFFPLNFVSLKQANVHL